MTPAARPSLNRHSIHRAGLLLALLLFAGGILSACNRSQPEAEAPAESGSEAPNQPVSEAGSDDAGDADDNAGSEQDADEPESAAQQAVLEALRARMDQKAYRITSTTQAMGQSITQEVEVVPPDRFRMTMMDMEVVMIEGSSYVRLGDEWTVNDSMSGMISAAVGQIWDEETIGKAGLFMWEIEEMGTESLNGVEAKVYRYIMDSSEQGGSGQTEATIWIGESEGLPLKQEVRIQGDGIDTSMIQQFDYDDSIVIEEPDIQ